MRTRRLPTFRIAADLPIDENADYVYICENNTIYGTKYKKLPNTKGKLLVSDVSSCFLSEPVNVSDYGILYGGVQKNIGPAGMVISVIREDLITDDVLPGHTDDDEVSRRMRMRIPCTTHRTAYGIYMCGKVFKWMQENGRSGCHERAQRGKGEASV